MNAHSAYSLTDSSILTHHYIYELNASSISEMNAPSSYLQTASSLTLSSLLTRTFSINRINMESVHLIMQNRKLPPKVVYYAN